jgi:N-acetylglucosamine kinase-like BadF-type ATPase
LAGSIFTYAFGMGYFLGLDGGGTKTECVLMDRAGTIISRSFSGPSNPSRVGVESAVLEIVKAAELSLIQGGVARDAVVALCAGMAGTGNTAIRERVLHDLQSAFPGVAVRVITDLEVALVAAGDGPVIVLVAGTGSAAIGRDAQGQTWRAGGHGPRTGDDGSAYDIGTRAVTRAMKEREGKGTDSSLGSKILGQLGYSSWPDLQQRAAEQPDAVFPLAFPIVAAAADAGDAVARDTLLQAARELSSLVSTVAEQMGYGRQSILIAKTGGTVGRSEFFDAQLDAALKKALPVARIGGLAMSPAEAAARIALTVTH